MSFKKTHKKWNCKNNIISESTIHHKTKLIENEINEVYT